MVHKLKSISMTNIRALLTARVRAADKGEFTVLTSHDEDLAVIVSVEFYEAAMKAMSKKG
jgi:PHD/YefM family antitoxin component YafN of YafNO toxin-antitoxin module